MRDTHLQGIHRAGRAVCVISAIVLAVPCLAAAQEAAAPAGSREIPRPDQLEPGVSTTPAAAAAPASTVTGVAPAASPAASAGIAPSQTAPAATASAAAPSAGAGKTGTPSAKAGARKGPDRLELDATDITGNRELPKVLYIVPWKRSDLGDVVGRPANSLLDEVLQPLDRDVFQRENRYYNALPPGAGDAKAGAAQGSPPRP
jgi:hypothetical protein